MNSQSNRGRVLRSVAASVALAFGLAAASLGAAAASEGNYAILDAFAGLDGDYDYISFDSEHQAVFVGRETGVMKVDLASRKVTPVFVKGDEVAAVLIIPGTPLMLATNSDGHDAVLFDRTSGVVKAHIRTGKGPDAALYEPSSRQVYVMNADSKDVSVIDPVKAIAVATIPLGDKPEAAASDSKGRVFVNLEGTAQIAVIDVASHKVTAKYTLPGCHEPTGLAYDETSGTLISACHNSVAKLIDAATGADRGSVAIGKGADGSIFDAQRRLAYVPCKDGTLAVFSLSAEGKAGTPTLVPTAKYARTAALDPQTGKLYLPVQDKARKGDDDEHVPSTFRVLVVGPK